MIRSGPALALGPRQHYLLGASGYTGVVNDTLRDRTFEGCSTLSDAAGVLYLNAAGTTDRVAYGTLAGAAAPEGLPVPSVPNDGQAMRRYDSGRQDTGSNVDDFTTVPASPKNRAATAP